jgi:hypothetical protein
MKIPARWSGQRAGFLLALALAFIVGAWLRLYLINDQVLIDDEWHGFYYALGKSPWFLLTHFSIPGATCIPLNFYTWTLGATIGWSETLLRLPSLVFGISLVAIGPWLARELVDEKRAGLFALFLAISPMLIFYSRIARPYSAVALLSFLALLMAARWMQTRRIGFAVGYVATATLAIYFHLFAVISVLAPIGMAVLYYGWSRLVRKRREAGPPFWQWCAVTGAIAILTAILVLPALWHSWHTTFFTVARAGTFDVGAISRVLVLMAGTGQPVLAVLFWGIAIVGAVEQARRNPWFGGLLVSLYPLHILALVISRPESAQSAIMLARYCIPLAPVTLLFAACGLQLLLETMAARARLQPALQTVIRFACVAALAAAGPLPQCYFSPNSFTSHGAYQHRYSLIDWRRSFYSDFTPAGFRLVTTIRADEISPFYRTLGQQPGNRPIVEYPMLIGDHFNPLYYYQYFHRRPVIVGYATDVTLARGLAAGNIFGNTYIDQVMTLASGRSKLKFHNLVSMDDLADMRRRGAEYVILHKMFEAQLSAVASPPPDLERLWLGYRKSLGPPAYEDDHIAVFRL